MEADINIRFSEGYNWSDMRKEEVWAMENEKKTTHGKAIAIKISSKNCAELKNDGSGLLIPTVSSTFAMIKHTKCDIGEHENRYIGVSCKKTIVDISGQQESES